MREWLWPRDKPQQEPLSSRLAYRHRLQGSRHEPLVREEDFLNSHPFCVSKNHRVYFR